MKKVVLGIGSNLGDREANIRQGVQLLRENPCIEIMKVSSLMENSAVSQTPQPDYLNAAILMRTILSPDELLQETKSIEKRLGRDQKGDGSPRPIDLDILFFDDEIICTDDLTVPHPLLHEREFVLGPLVELIPDFVHPILQETISNLHSQVVGY